MKHQECMFCGRSGEITDDDDKSHHNKICIIGRKKKKFICWDCATQLGQALLGSWKIRVEKTKIK